VDTVPATRKKGQDSRWRKVKGDWGVRVIDGGVGKRRVRMITCPGVITILQLHPAQEKRASGNVPNEKKI